MLEMEELVDLLGLVKLGTAALMENKSDWGKANMEYWKGRYDLAVMLLKILNPPK